MSQNFLPGDWVCQSCNVHNFARNQKCRDCKQPKIGHNLNNDRYPDRGYRNGGGRYNDRYDRGYDRYDDRDRGRIPANFKPGDWICSQQGCHHHNFARQSHCRRCSASKFEVSGNNFKAGDWYCPDQSCNYHNYAKLASCRMCTAPRPENLPDFAPPPHQSNQNFMPGDWTCQSCEEHNFAKRETCRKCQAQRPENLPDFAPPPQGNTGQNFMSGDWTCTDCMEHNFAKRTNCRKCQKSKEEVGGGDNQ